MLVDNSIKFFFNKAAIKNTFIGALLKNFICSIYQ